MVCFNILPIHSTSDGGSGELWLLPQHIYHSPFYHVLVEGRHLDEDTTPSKSRGRHVNGAFEEMERGLAWLGGGGGGETEVGTHAEMSLCSLQQGSSRIVVVLEGACACREFVALYYTETGVQDSGLVFFLSSAVTGYEREEAWRAGLGMDVKELTWAYFSVDEGGVQYYWWSL